MMVRRICIALMAALLALPFAAGCVGRMIEEDYYDYDLPEIDPEDGVEKELPVTLYYRLTGEDCLTPIHHSVRVRANERTETAVIRELIAGVPPQSRGVSPLFPQGVQVGEVSYEGGILYVTLSNEMLDESALAQIVREDYDDEAEYAMAMEAERSEMLLKRRLALLSIVNTIVDSSDDDELKVQVMIDTDGSGSGSRVTYSTMGFEGFEHELIEPLGFQEEAVANPKRIVQYLLEHLSDGEYERAYMLIAGGEGEAMPSYQSFRDELEGLGSVTEFSVVQESFASGEITVTADVRYISPEGRVIQVSNARLTVAVEHGLYKVVYSSLKDMMEN